MPARVFAESLFWAIATFSICFTASFFSAKLGGYEMDLANVVAICGGLACGTFLGRLMKSWVPRQTSQAALKR